MHEVIMPKLGLTMESGKIEKWHKKEGEKIETGDILFEVMTDKVSLEVESYNSGVLKKILKFEGEEVPVTEVVAYIGNEDEIIPEESQKKDVTATGSKETSHEKTSYTETEDQTPKTGKKVKKERIRISPIAKKLVRENNLDITKIIGSGPLGRIVKKDILDIIVEQEREIAAAKNISNGIKIRSSNTLSGMRKSIADRMSLSKATIPHLVQFVEVDVTGLVKLREEMKEGFFKKYKQKITYTDFIIMASAAALKENMIINSTLQEGEHIIYDDINIGLAVSIEDGLIVPTIFNADKLGIKDIAKIRSGLIEKAQNGKLNLSEVQNGTFTITNLGMLGIRSSVAIINPPQASILAVGEIYNKPAVLNDSIKIGSFMDLSASCDHRLIDGALAAKFLTRIAELLQNPLSLLAGGLLD